MKTMKTEVKRQKAEGRSEHRTSNIEHRTPKAERQTRGLLTAALTVGILLSATYTMAADEAAKPADSAKPAVAPTVENKKSKIENPPKTLEDVVVTASRSAREANTIPANVSVITAEQIANTTAQSVPDVLRNEAGVQVSDWTGSGRTTSVDIRGFGETAANNTLVLVDGRRLNSADVNEVDWTTIPLERIERIEVVRGGGSVLYGDKAVGGVVNIITKKGAEKNTLTSETSAGSYGTFKQALGFAGSHGPLSYALNGSYADSDGYRDNGGFRNKTAGLSLGYDANKWFSVDGNAGIKDDHYGLPGWRLPGQDRRGTSTPNDYAETRGFYLQATPKFKLGEDAKLEIGLNHTETEYFANWAAWGMTDKYRVDESSIKPKVTVTKEIAGMEHEFTSGVDYTYSQRNPMEGDFRQEIDKGEAGYYLNDTVALVPEQLFLDLGYRRTQIDYQYQDGAGSEDFGINSYRAGLTYAYAPKSKVFVSADRSFRTMLLTGEQFGASPILPPQTSWTYQTGVKHFINRYITLGATAFEIDTTDEIFYDPNAGMWGSNTNYPKTQRRGIELSATSDPLDTVHLYTNYTWMDARLQGGAYDGNRIPMAATHSAQAGVTWSPLSQIDLDLRARWMSDRYSISDWGNVNRDWEGDRFVVVDTKLTYKPTKWLKLYAGVNNIFNEEYSEYGTYSSWMSDTVLYPSAERNFVGGVVITKEF